MADGVTLDRRGLDALLAASRALDAVAVDFGAMGEGGGPAPRHPSGGGTTADVLAAHEYGLGGNDETPIVRAVAHGKGEEIGEVAAKAAAKVLAGTATPDEAAKSVGEHAVGLLRARIESVGLIDTGATRDSLTWARGRK